MYIATQILLTYFTTMTPAGDVVTDICDVVHRQTRTPTVCSPHRTGAPVYDDNVCCAGSTCFEPTANGSCDVGETLYYCGLGEPGEHGTVDCYFEVVDYCDAFACGPSPGYETQPQAGWVCCEYDDICTEFVSLSGTCQVENIYYCVSVATAGDGTVICADWD